MTEREMYLEAKYEFRAMGDFDFPSFDIWSGKSDLREIAEFRVKANESAND